MTNYTPSTEELTDKHPRMLDAALDYAARSWDIFPVHGIENGVCSCDKGKECGRPGKHPLTHHGLKDATNDETQIRKWWTQWPEANIAVATGARSGLLVVDADGAEGMASLQEDNHALPETVTAQSGRADGGRHNYFLRSPPTLLRWIHSARPRARESGRSSFVRAEDAHRLACESERYYGGHRRGGRHAARRSSPSREAA